MSVKKGDIRGGDGVKPHYYDNPLRWSDEEHDYCWGPFLYSTSDYRPWTVILSSYGGGEDDNNRASLRLSSPWLGTLIIGLPRWLVPGPTITRTYPDDPKWKAPDGEVFKRLGRDYYETADAHEYGFTMSRSGTVGDSSFLQVKLGRSTNDSTTDRSWSCFLPWTEWRHIGIRYYGLQGELAGAVYDDEVPKTLGSRKYDMQRDLEARIPKAMYRFRDFDGEEIMATCHVEEREWHAGRGWFSWLSWARKPIIRRSLSIDFSSEVGRKKGSWKGGTLGHSIEMGRGPDGQFFEGHLGAFMRYCSKHELEFVAIGDWPVDVKAELTPKKVDDGRGNTRSDQG